MNRLYVHVSSAHRTAWYRVSASNSHATFHRSQVRSHVLSLVIEIDVYNYIHSIQCLYSGFVVDEGHHRNNKSHQRAKWRNGNILNSCSVPACSQGCGYFSEIYCRFPQSLHINDGMGWVRSRSLPSILILCSVKSGPVRASQSNCPSVPEWKPSSVFLYKQG